MADNILEKAKRKREEQISRFRELILQNYSPQGKTEDKEYKTTAEIQYMYDNIMSLSAGFISEALSGAGFEIEYIGGQPYWVMYDKSFELK